MISNNSLELPELFQRSLSRIIYTEARVWIPLSIIVFITASLLMSNWPAGLIPNTQYPYLYSSDGIFNAQWSKRLIEGWSFNSALSGYPFGSNYFDFPSSDAGNHAALKILGIIFGSYQASLNLYFLLGFAVCFSVSYAVFRAINLSRLFSIAGAVIFIFLPFHLLRLEHLFYTWYFVVPVYFYYGYRIFSSRPPFMESEASWKSRAIDALLLMVMASFGVYYAFFGVIVFAVSGIAGAIQQKSKKTVLSGIAAIFFVASGVFVNVLPNIVNIYKYGRNPEVATRAPAESEVYGLKLTQMLLPRPDHRSDRMANLTKSYSENFPLVTENYKSSLGTIGAVGFISILCVAFISLLGRKVDMRLTFLACTTIALFFFATIGGFSSLFAMLVSPMIRAWNRASIFIGFASIASVLILLEFGLNKYVTNSRKFAATVIVAFALIIFGLWDQTTPPCVPCNDAIRIQFESDRTFVRDIENIIPSGAAIYQLPYMAYPEVPPLHRLEAYGLMRGYLHSDSLHWNYGGMKGRDGDLFYRDLAQQSLQNQIIAISKLGFSGIYLDRRGFADGGSVIEKELGQILGSGPHIVSKDAQLAFYRITPDNSPVDVGTEASQIIKRADIRSDAAFEESVDFRKLNLPIFIKGLEGVSVPEPWGRWSDANLGDAILIKFAEPLPKSFTLVLRAQAFGPNIGRSVKVKVGDQSETVAFSGNLEERRIIIKAKTLPMEIQIIPPAPTSPKSLGMSADSRKLGILLERLFIER